MLGRVACMLRGDGVFFFTGNRTEPVEVTLKRRLAVAVRPLLFSAPRRYVDVRLREFTVSEERVRALGEDYFEQVTITKWRSDTIVVTRRARALAIASLAFWAGTIFTGRLLAYTYVILMASDPP